jgi:hypothetical protein
MLTFLLTALAGAIYGAIRGEIGFRKGREYERGLSTKPLLREIKRLNLQLGRGSERL